MCLLIIFRTVIKKKKTSNFTSRSGRDQRQTKEIANSLQSSDLIFKLSFTRYLQLGDKTHSKRNLLTFVSATFADISTGFLLGYLYIKGAECLE